MAVGKTRAKAFETQQNQASDQAFFDSVLCVQLHGDSAFAGQGIVAETFQMANLEDFTVGGSLHLIVNNQLGFTCSSKNARSSRYASDLAKMIGCPIFHVNSEHPEAIAKAIDLALKYRKTFKKDIVVDLIGFRKYGHNELDEPSFTQPLMYGKIRQKDSIGYIYESKLNEENLKTSVSVMDIEKSYVDYLEKEFDAATTYEPSEEMTLQGKWKGLTFKQNEPVDTGVEMTLLQLVGKASVAIPEKFNIHPRLLKHHIEPRLQSLLDKKSLIDWATAEALAFGSLLINEKVSIRLSGQDSGRGTFSHRHVQLTDQETQEIYIPLNHIAKDNEKDSENGKIIPVNTYLSELAVLGFEYGYSLESPKNLVIWEAQFGDFFNGAQTIIDAFVTSGEDKWFRQSGLVMLLPHGYDGAGPEHSSARLERFLQLSNEPLIETKDFLPKHSNIDVVNPTTPAQYFHLLRRQIVRNFRKPLILMAPKTLLRHPLATSSLDQFTEGTTFQPILDDSKFIGNKQRKVKKLLIVSGKFYYDLLKERAQLQLDSTVAIICMEQLAPFPWKELKLVLSKYTNLQKVVWCQEEPRNMGAFSFVSPRIQQLLPSHLGLYYAGRLEMAAPATGVSAIYKREQEALIKLPFEMVNS